MRKEIDKALKKKTLITSIVATGLGLVLFAVFIPLACKGIVPNEVIRYLAFVATLVLIWVPYIFLLLRIKFDYTVLIVYLVFLFLASLVGCGYSVYQLVSWYDIVIHFSSGIVIGFVWYTLFSENSKSKLGYFWMFLFIVSFGMFCGALWEIYEFLGDLIAGLNMQRTAGLVGQKAILDTMIDICCDLGGSIVAAVCCMFIERNKRRTEKEETAETVEPALNKTEQ